MKRRKDDASTPVTWQGRLKVELARLEARNRQTRWISVLAVLILVWGAASLFGRKSFWRQEAIEIKFPPSMLFVVLILLVLLVLYLVRRELEVRRLNLLALEERVVAETERSEGMIDSLTHVFNRRFLTELLQGEISRAERNQRPLTLAMCDVNHFKEVNDRYGHPVGDEVLTETANILKSCVRGSDFVVRYGGDEFLLVLSETDGSGASAVLARVREKMAEWDRQRLLGISLSIGVYAHRAGQSPDQDIAAVDAQMYAEKQAVRTTSSRK
ncbi:MAG TPA: GGDEF domain-containing protein [Terriglobia bacterium]|nr:GGDEF domain-containing protein [Terriglobia bacterium]